ncbi:alpha/beta hydrolase [bacterium]|nr:alpha/beta hydrolase [bacterium]
MKGDTLERVASVPREKWEGIETRYDAVLTEKGHWLRSIVTRPLNRTGKIPGILVVGWLSCDTVEIGAAPRGGFAKLMHGLLTKSGYAMMRIDKPGIGDSGGPSCNTCDFETELAGYKAALRVFKKYDFIDPERIVLLGLSNGGGFAPLVAEKEKIAAYIVSGGWSKTWLEHMLEIEHRRLGLEGRSSGEISREMQRFAEFYTYYLIHKMTPRQITTKYSHLANLWYDEPEHKYGRPAVFFQQLQALNLAAAWEQVRVPVLVIYGEYDWIMSRSDHEWIAEIVNRNAPGRARYVEIPKMDHGFTIQENIQESFRNFGGGRFDESLVTLIQDWLRQTVK